MMCCYPCIVIDRQMDAAAFSQRPIAMTIKNDHKFSLLSRLAGWWRSPRNQRASVPNSVRTGDADLNEAKPRTLAGKWPCAGNPLDQRLKQLYSFDDEPGHARARPPLVEGKS